MTATLHILFPRQDERSGSALLEMLAEHAEAGDYVEMPTDEDIPPRLRGKVMPAARLAHFISIAVKHLTNRQQSLADAHNQRTMAQHRHGLSSKERKRRATALDALAAKRFKQAKALLKAAMGATFHRRAA